MEKLKGSMLIFPSDIQIITGFTKKVAEREHRTVRDALAKKSKRLSVRQYCNYFELDYQEVVTAINPYR